MKRRIRAFEGCLWLLLVALQPVWGIHPGENDLPYSQPMTHPLDKPLNDKYNGKCFFMNLGPTGIRARIDLDAPKKFKVTYVFQDAKSPAHGKITIGDVIVGANGKSFREEHGFHRKKGGRGWVGPPFELALAIEDSQGKDGKLELIVYPGGNRNKVKKVTLQLEPVGKFSDTYPWNCERSAKLRKKLVDFMLKNKPEKTRLWLEVQYTLALWASGDRRANSLVRDLGRRLEKTKINPLDNGMCTWTWGYVGVFLGEYYNAYKSNSAKSMAESLAIGYETSQTYANGGASHRPYPAIQRRVASGGPKGYGAMAGPGGLAMLAQSLFRQNGLPYSTIAYGSTHQAYLRTAGSNESGTLAYGFGKSWDRCTIQLKDPKSSPCQSKEGIGFLCPSGMKDIGDFLVEKWTEKGPGKWDVKLVPPSKVPWLKTDADNLRVYDIGNGKRSVVRPVMAKEPTSPFKNSHIGGGHIAPVGMGAMAHLIGNSEKSWQHLGKHMATGCAYSPHMLWDGHAAAEMHAFFGVLGASWAKEKDFRRFLDYSKTWIILSETHDGGGLVEQPFGCQRNSTCSLYGGRNRMAYTHVALMLLSIPNRNLLMTGAKSGKTPAAAGLASNRSSGIGRRSTTSGMRTTLSKRKAPTAANDDAWKPKRSTRRGRSLGKGQQENLNKALHGILGGLVKKEEFKGSVMSISKVPNKVKLVGVQTRGGLTFQMVGSEITRPYYLSSLSSKDRAALAVVVAKNFPDSNDAQAMAAVFCEIAGYTADADDYFKKAGAQSKAKFEKLFK